MLELTAAKIAEIAFGGIIQGAVGKVTEMVVEKLRDKIYGKLRGNLDAEKAIIAVEQGSKSELPQVAKYLDAFMTIDPTFAQEIRVLASQVQINNTQDNTRNNTFQNNEKVYYTETVHTQEAHFGDNTNYG